MSDCEPDDCQYTSEFYDILSEKHWDGRMSSLQSVLEAFHGVPDKMLDIGAGSGRGTALLSTVFPQKEIVALEPSAGMRTALMTRIFMTPGLRDFVTVVPFSFNEASLQPKFDIILACGCIGFFDANERTLFWRRLFSLLALGGLAVVDTMPIDQPAPVDKYLAAQTRIGTYRYDIWLSGTPGKEDIMNWHMRFEVWDGDQLIRHIAVDRPWHAMSLNRLAQEATQAGLLAERMTDGPVPGVIIRRHS